MARCARRPRSGCRRAPAPRRFLMSLPLFHIASLHNLALPRLATGDTIVIDAGRFDVDRVLAPRSSARRSPTGRSCRRWPTGSPRTARWASYDLSSLAALSINSAPSSPALKDRVRAAVPNVAGRPGRQLRPDRGEHGGHGRHAARPRPVPRHGRRADPVGRGLDPRRRRHAGRRRRRGRDLAAQPVHDARLLGRRRRDGGDDHARRVAAHRRPRPPARRPAVHGLAALRPDPARRRERLPGRDRGGARRASGR